MAASSFAIAKPGADGSKQEAEKAGRQESGKATQKDKFSEMGIALRSRLCVSQLSKALPYNELET